MRRVAFFGALVLAACAATLPQQAQGVVEVRIHPGILDSLGILAHDATKETVRCLIGAPRNDTLFVDYMYAPQIEYADADSVATGPCSRATIIAWHNHVFYPEGWQSPRERCFLSPTDVQTALQSSVFIWVVQVRKNLACWWTQPQIAILAKRYPVVWPVEGQIGPIPRSDP